ncbi:keratin, type I cytoskeletal 19-like [Ascaphus truei]|uniref:keratin, type I cytoskeletal 19-like n=1 Tax=Ascaphus truei TaxID=8439 RepID=UPI003F594856
MSSSVKQTHSGSIKGSCNGRDSSPKISNHISSLHLGSFPKVHAGSPIPHHGGSQKVHCGGHYRAPSVHGGSGGKGVSISRHSSFGHGCDYGSVHGVYGHGSYFGSFGDHSGCKNDGMFSINEKETMQLLNYRLSSYLETVHSLEQENTQLEGNIQEWYDRNQPKAVPDFNNYLRTIQELQGQISAASVEDARIVLQIDNARLTANDFSNKYEMELNLRNNVEADVNCLRRVLERLSTVRCNLEMQVKSLQEELLQMRRNHEEEVNNLRTQLGARVNVEVNAAPSVDMNRALSEIREQYENLMERNMREAENMFLARSEELNREVGSDAEQLQSVNSELIELRRTVQTLEIELQTQLSMKSALECTLAETEDTYSSQLTQLQGLIDNVEAQLGQIRSDLERQNLEYRLLMDQKTHLETEIATYKRLLDGQDTHVPGPHGKDGSRRVKIHQTTEHAHQIKG